MSDTSNLSEDRRALLEKLLRGNTAKPTADSGGIVKRPHNGPVPLAIRQQPFWLRSKMTANNAAYNEVTTIQLPGPLDEAAFQRSLDEIIRRHEAWRTSFPLVEDQPMQ